MSQHIERFGKNIILKLNLEGFDSLDLKNKQLTYHLSQAGLYGRNIIFEQNYKHNIVIKNTLELMYRQITESNHNIIKTEIFENFTLYLKNFWFNAGIYNSFSNKLIDVTFSQDDFKELLLAAKLKLNDSNVKIVLQVFFTPDFVKQYKKIQEDGVDVIANYGGNFYDGLTNTEVKCYRMSIYEKTEDSPQFGFNSKLSIKKTSRVIKPSNSLYNKSLLGLAESTIKILNMEMETEDFISSSEEDKSKLLAFLDDVRVLFNNNESKNIYYIHEDIIFENGLYGNYIKKIIEHLEFALDYTENQEQENSISSLITFYKTGKAEDFDKHSLSWIKDTESRVFFINGLIESYDDPKGVACSFESIVAFKNLEQTKKANNITNNIQWFEDNLPVSSEFKKTEAIGLSASSITTVSMSGDSSPALPLGVCLPNSDWIRAKHGSKSVNLANVHNARGESEGDIKKAFFLPEYLNNIKKYGSIASSLHTDLHEIAGHGSCKNLPDVSNSSLDIYYSVIEETRADLVGLYFINSPKLIEFDVINADTDLIAFGETQYINYISNGALLQLKRVELGKTLAQPHLRNRQLISQWILEKAKESRCVELVNINEETFVKLNDFEQLRTLFGELLSEIQRIKSTGDFSAAKAIVEKYGTQINYELHSEILSRFEKLDTPNSTGFLTPLFYPVFDRNGNLSNYHIHHKGSFIEDQLYLSDKYS